MSSQMIAVMGATGAQGGAVVDALLKNNKFQVRALTRNPSSESAMALVSKGVKEVVKADADDLESLVKAFEGCYGVFAVTNFWAHMDMGQQMRNIGDAGERAQVKHMVVSTLEDSREFVKEGTMPILNEQFKSYVPHFDAKGEMSKYIASKVPTTQYYTCFYFENFIIWVWGQRRLQRIQQLH